MTGDNFNRNTRKETAMFPKSVGRLADVLAVALRLNKARGQCLAGIVIGVAESKSVLLADLATRLPGNATTTSTFRRLQDFFLEVLLDFNAVAALLMGFIGKLTDEPLTLAMDRTNWEARGNDVNILVLSVCLGDVGLPIFWIDLRMAGNSDTPCRIGVVSQFMELFGVDRIHVLVGDREFIGGDWFSWLIAEDIPFVMRLRENILLSSKRGSKRYARNFFHGLRRGEFRQLDKRRGCGVEMTVVGVKTSKGELLILACHGIEGSAATEAYMRRWNIETGFEKLKSHGFHMESSRLQGDGKMELLLAALAIAMAWTYSCGTWSVEHVAPIRLKKHGRPEHSIFARGLMLLGDLLHGVAKDMRRVALFAFGILRAAGAAMEK
jgi:hypothetical protein